MREPRPYLFKLDDCFSFTHPALAGIEFENEWVFIRNGFMRIKKGYAWNGCSPKLDVLGLFVVGTPDGRLRHGKPITYFASCAHDALCQFRDVIPVSQVGSVQIFSHLLQESEFYLEPIYTTFVDWLGPQDWIGG